MADRALHIGIDGRELLGRPTGVGRYLSTLLEVWTSDPMVAHRFTVVVPAEPSPAARRAAGGAVWQIAPAAHAGTRWEQRALPRALAGASVDVLFAPAYTAPLFAPCPVVQTIHDLSYFAHPEWFTWREGLRRRTVTKWSARRAARILTDSAFSAGEIATHLHVDRDLVRVVPLGVRVPQPPAAPVARAPLVLFVGSIFQRRRLPDTIAGFARAAAHVPDARLAIVGDNRSTPPIDIARLAADAGVGDRVDWHRYVDDDALERLYWSARAFVFLSEYEGFAMTPMEALAHDVPVVLLDTPVARAIYGDAAAFVTGDPGEVGAALTTLLTDPGAHLDAVARGRALSARHRWSESARETLEAIEQAAQRR